jgi:hypothetical protein
MTEHVPPIDALTTPVAKHVNARPFLVLALADPKKRRHSGSKSERFGPLGGAEYDIAAGPGFFE